MQLYEKYRPRQLSEVVGQDKACAVMRGLIGRGVGGRAIWLSGASGTGKTTLARIAAESIADPLFVREYDTADALTLAELGGIEESMGLCAWGKGGRAFVINEAHGLRETAIRKLLGMLERIPPHVLFVFTTTKEGQDALFGDTIDASPLLSRCIRVSLTNQGLAQAFAERVRTVAMSEGLDGQPVEDYVKLARKCANNCRAMYQAVEAGEMIR
jgi:replication-associated recombination protein RarA